MDILERLRESTHWMVMHTSNVPTNHIQVMDDAHDEIKQLREERDAWKRSSESFERQGEEHYNKLLQQDADLAVVVEFIKDYGAHMAGCKNHFSRNCECGYNEARRDLTARFGNGEDEK